MKGRLGTTAIIIAATAIIIAALAAAPASAGTLYKCVGADGVPSYVSKRVSGAQCSTISYRRDTARPAAATRSAVPAPTPTPVASPSPLIASGAASESPAATVLVAPAAAATAPVQNKAGRVVSGQVYSYMKDGVRHYTSSRPTQVASAGPVRTIAYSYIERCFACGVTPRVNFGAVRLNTTSFQAEIAAAAREFGVEEAIVRAVIHAESAYNPTALSRAGAQGLMQLMPPTAARFGVTDSYDAGQNIRGGVQYLSWLLKRFNGDLTLAAAGYNAGEGAVARHGGVPPYSETRYYVQRVGQLAERYRSALAP
ncbi:lytic transglycosylase domain-containing protein [Stenotrophomonas sp. C3(2023)]|uniref:lytic transglycosylase domain-containing protein n=1 Tax=Stenotrophomonas sp. C3(2023) TaxID=3080277 RepID=UPI00293CDB52|nr:lytic transglycosylase domain-containing protein [Stenotrophomonas sp. C3(2023)]MDV3469174.1 lytic transglycosylase domain-containing protein [Stenotrophomonas sp. C3(2023)]